MRTFAPFDNTRVVRDEGGCDVRYLTDPLAETYLEPPGAWISEGMLPPEDLEVRRALAWSMIGALAGSVVSNILGIVARRSIKELAMAGVFGLVGGCVGLVTAALWT